MASQETTTSGKMISKDILILPQDPAQLVKVLQKILREHYQDIKTLFDTTTDCDLYEKKQRDNQQL